MTANRDILPALFIALGMVGALLILAVIQLAVERWFPQWLEGPK